MERKIDLTISQSRLFVSTREFGDEEGEWGPGNLAQGALILPDLLVLDPLSDEEFGADIILRQPLRFSADKRAQRSLQLPLSVAEDAELMLGSVTDEEGSGIVLPAGEHTLIYEICVGRDVFYTLTLLAQPCVTAQALKADGWGLKKQQPLQHGRF